jgi:hypothetical protein
MTDEQLTKRIDALLDEIDEATTPGPRGSCDRVRLYELVMMAAWDAGRRDGVSLEVSKAGIVRSNWG